MPVFCRPLCLLLLSFLGTCLCDRLSAQDTIPELGQIHPADFTATSPIVDSNANAVVLADIGNTVLEGYQDGFRIVFTRFRRVRILKREGLKAATISLNYSAEDNKDRKLRSLKAYTYNLENGKIVKTPVSSKDFFLEKPEGDHVEERFTFPDIRIGSIIEYTYTVKSSGIFRLHPWQFQCEYPTLYSTYTTKVPDIFGYVFLTQGRKAVLDTAVDAEESTAVAGSRAFRTYIHTSTWTEKDIPALREEPFISTTDNYISQVTFQLSRLPMVSYWSLPVLDNWKTTAVRLLVAEGLGKPFKEKEEWMTRALDSITRPHNTPLETARDIFTWIRDDFKKDGRGIMLSPGATFESVSRQKTGTVADINLLLTALLKYKHIDADPVILSTRENGLINVNYPIMENYNYVICRALIDGKVYYLDASQPNIAFGRLPAECYNGPARVLTADTYPVFLSTDSVIETKMTTVFMYNGENNNLEASFTINPGDFESLVIRNHQKKKGLKDFFTEWAKGFPFEPVLDSTAGIDSLRPCEAPLNVHCNIRFPFSGNRVYFNPMLNAGFPSNPFPVMDRMYPVELPFRVDETYVLNMEMPQHYVVEEMPKPIRLSLKEDKGSFEYSIGISGDHILLKSRLMLKTATFDPIEYDMLREFYTQIVKKHAEMIVFKRQP